MIYFVKQPNYKYLVYSTKINSIIMYNMEVYQIIDYYGSVYPKTSFKELAIMFKTINVFGSPSVACPSYKRCLEFTRLNDRSFYNKITGKTDG